MLFFIEDDAEPITTFLKIGGIIVLFSSSQSSDILRVIDLWGVVEFINKLIETDSLTMVVKKYL